MKRKDRICFLVLLGSFLLGLAGNILCLVEILPYFWWRWVLGGVALLLITVWLILGRTRKNEPEFDLITTRPRLIASAVVVLPWCLTLFAIIFQN